MTPSRAPSVLIIDNHEAFGTSLGRGLRELGCATALSTDLRQAEIMCSTSAPSLIVTELRVDGRWAFDFIPELRVQLEHCKVVIVTVYPSIATAVHAIRIGFHGYFAKPVTARAILDAMESTNAEREEHPARDTRWPTLQRTIWEYLNHVFVEAGTMSEAARRLGVDRRSLRRMLAKYPPVS
jgi:two-component system response regulator RegA